MSVLENLKTISMDLRKKHDPLGSFLNSVVSEVKNLAKADTKNGVTPNMNDDYAVRAIRTCIKQQDDFLAIVGPASNGAAVASKKKEILLSLLPVSPSTEDLNRDIADYIRTESLLLDRTSIGKIMKYLSEKYGAALDKSVASKLIMAIIKP